jgi:hypothetical protein
LYTSFSMVLGPVPAFSGETGKPIDCRLPLRNYIGIERQAGKGGLAFGGGSLKVWASCET